MTPWLRDAERYKGEQGDRSHRKVKRAKRLRRRDGARGAGRDAEASGEGEASVSASEMQTGDGGREAGKEAWGAKGAGFWERTARLDVRGAL